MSFVLRDAGSYARFRPFYSKSYFVINYQKMTVLRESLISVIKRARLPEVIQDTDLSHLITGTPARRHNLVKRALAKGDLLQIRRGLYTLSELYRNKRVHPFQLAQWIYGPSYISFESALSYWELIPEAVHTVTSGTSRRSKEFQTPLGRYAFVRIPFPPLYAGVKRIVDGGALFFMAKPLRALADYVYVSRKDWTLRSLADFLRMEDLPSVDSKTAFEMRRIYDHRRVRRFIDSCLELTDGH